MKNKIKISLRDFSCGLFFYRNAKNWYNFFIKISKDKMEDNPTASSGSATSEESAKFTSPEKVLEQLEIRPGNIIADFGCGTGYFTFPLAEKVKDEGKVYALDILADKLEAIESQAKVSGINNVEVKRVNLEKVGGSGLEDESIDWVFLVNMLFQNPDKGTVLAEAKRVLKPGAKIVVVEWKKEETSLGPKADTRISKEEIEELAKNNQFSITNDLNVDDFHYGIVLSK